MARGIHTAAIISDIPIRKISSTNREVFLDSPALVLNVWEYLGRETVFADVDCFTVVVTGGVNTARVINNTVLHDPGVGGSRVPTMAT